MEVKDQIQIKFYGVDIINVNFNLQRPVGAKDNVSIDVECDPKIVYSKDDSRLFKIFMSVKLEAKDYFDFSMIAIGNFKLKEDISDENRKQFVNVNAPAMMFPYVRSFVSTFSANLGQSINTIVIPTQFFKGEIEELKFEEE